MDSKIMTPQEWYKEKYGSDNPPSWMSAYNYTIQQYAEYVAKERAVALLKWIEKMPNEKHKNIDPNISAEDFYKLFTNEINEKK